jgi:hypothetical protein
MVAWARKALEDGAVPIFFAYSLGKAQEAIAILGRGGIPLAAHGAVASMTRVYEDAGVAMPPYERYDPKSVRRDAGLDLAAVRPSLPAGGARPKPFAPRR